MSPILGLLVAASLGALIGLVRQWENQRNQTGERVQGAIGLRTFMLWALAGNVSALAATFAGTHFFPVAFAVFVLFLASNLMRLRRKPGQPGLTTHSAGLLTFFLGALVHWEQTLLATALACGIMLVLASREWMHGITRKLTEEDLRAVLQFAAITGVVLPLVPNQAYGPYDSFNPWSIWLMVVLVAGMGFLGYTLMRLLGERAGIILTGIAGGLASSTATTLAFSKRSRDNPAESDSLTLGIAIACTVMLVRVAAVVAVLHRPTFDALWPVLVWTALPGSLFALHVLRGGAHRNASSDVETPKISNPLGLGLSIKFALLYAIVVLGVKAMHAEFGQAGLLVVAFLSGLTDMDAIAVSSSRAASGGTLVAAAAAQAIVVGAVANTLIKAAFAVSLGSPRLKRAIALVLGATILSSLAGAWIVL